MPGIFMLHFDRKRVLLKYRSFLKFWEPPFLQGRIPVAKLLKVLAITFDWSALAT